MGRAEHKRPSRAPAMGRRDRHPAPEAGCQLGQRRLTMAPCRPAPSATPRPSPTPPSSERTAACVLARGRRLGPYGAAGTRREFRQKDLAALARAGFSLDVARRVLAARDPDALDRLMRGLED